MRTTISQCPSQSSTAKLSDINIRTARSNFVAENFYPRGGVDVAQFEAEAEHRRECERKQLRFAVRDAHIGKVLAGLYALSALGVSAFRNLN